MLRRASLALPFLLLAVARAQDPTPGIKGKLEGARAVDVQSLFVAEDRPEVLVAAHRANSGRWLARALDWALERKHGDASRAENSLAAIDAAIAAGTDIVEVDVRHTKDGVLVLMHDAEIDRTTDGKGKVSDLTWAELQQVTLLPQGKIPTLVEALRHGKGRVVFDLDLKTDRVEDVVAAVKEADALGSALFFDANRQLLLRARAVDPRVELMPRAHGVAETLALIQDAELRPKVVHVDVDDLTPEVKEAASKAGVRLWINALGPRDVFADRLFYRRLIRRGAGVIQTDRPACVIRAAHRAPATPDEDE